MVVEILEVGFSDMVDGCCECLHKQKEFQDLTELSIRECCLVRILGLVTCFPVFFLRLPFQDLF